MVNGLIRMKLAVLRHSMSRARATWMSTGATAGLVVAAGTIFLATRDSVHTSAVGDLLAVAFALWALGWLVGPVWGGEPMLRPDQFRLLPIPRRRLAIGLLGAAFVGITTGVTLLAFASLVVYGARLGVEPAVVAIPAVVLQIVFVVLVSRVAGSVFGAMTASRIGGAFVGVMTAVMLVVSQSGWVLIERAGHVLQTGFSSELSTIVRMLPSSWGVVAVDAAHRSEWALTALALTGLAALTALLIAGWSRMLGSPRAPRATIRGPRGVGLLRAVPAGDTHAVIIKELRTWWRDPSRTGMLVMAPTFALMTCLLPLIYSSTAALPWAAPITVLMAATTTSNLYGEGRHSPMADPADTGGRATRCAGQAVGLVDDLWTDDRRDLDRPYRAERGGLGMAVDAGLVRVDPRRRLGAGRPDRGQPTGSRAGSAATGLST